MVCPDLRKELHLAFDLASKAGSELLKAYHSRKELEIEVKEDNSPVTAADRRANEIILNGLQSRFPEHGILSEETADNHGRLRKEFVWMVDPLDGTRDFIQGENTFTVIIGLVWQGNPVLGVVHSPTEKKMYTAIRGLGAYSAVYPYPSGSKIAVSSVDQIPKMRMLISCNRPENEGIEQLVRMPFAEVYKTGGAGYKAMMIAEGVGEAWYHRGQKMYEWDVCASYVILQEAGGEATDFCGNPLRFNQENPCLTKGILVSNGKCHQQLVDLLAPLRLG